MAGEDTLTHRLRSLVRTAPLHRIEIGKVLRSRDLAHHDLRALALRVIDATIEHMGLGYGARRSDLVDDLEPMVRAVEADASRKDVEEITDIVVDHLLNESARRLQFDEPYLDFDGHETTPRTVRFHLLKEEEADDGSIVIKATTEAINLYAGMLDVDVEDAQTAAEAVLQAQIERGAIDSAVATAKQARMRSIEYGETLRSTLRQVRRDVSQVDATEMLGIAAKARRHLDERLRVERGLIDSVEQRVGAADAEDAPALVALKDALTDCRRRHLELHNEVLGMNQTWLSEQERQRFRRVRASALPELQQDVFEVLIRAPLGSVDSMIDELLRPFHAPVAPRVFDLEHVVESLLAPRRRERDPDLEDVTDELDPIAAPERRFDAWTVQRVEDLLGSGDRLTTLLDLSRTAGDPVRVRQLLILRCLWAWDPDDDEPLASTPAGRFRDAEFEGHDMEIGDRR